MSLYVLAYRIVSTASINSLNFFPICISFSFPSFTALAQYIESGLGLYMGWSLPTEPSRRLRFSRGPGEDRWSLEFLVGGNVKGPNQK